MRLLTRNLIAAAALSLAAGYATADVKVGFMATMSGSAAALGQDMYDGFMLALEQNGGKLGGQKIDLVKEDDQLKPDVGVQIVQKFIEKDKVDIVAGVTFSNVMMAIAKPLADADMTFVGSNAGPAPLGRWMSQRPTMDPDLWIETISYKETREYVARVLSFSTLYDWRLNGGAVRLTDRMQGLPNGQRKGFACATPDAPKPAQTPAPAAPTKRGDRRTFGGVWPRAPISGEGAIRAAPAPERDPAVISYRRCSPAIASTTSRPLLRRKRNHASACATCGSRPHAIPRSMPTCRAPRPSRGWRPGPDACVRKPARH